MGTYPRVRPEVFPDMNGQSVHSLPSNRPGRRVPDETWVSGPEGARALVELSIPARPEALQLARLSAGFVAAKARLDYDEVQDLRLAIDELCLSLLRPDGANPRGRLLLSYSWDDIAVEITCTVTSEGDERLASATGRSVDAVAGHGGTRLAAGAISRQILDALVDDHAVSLGASRSYGWLRKCRTGTARR